MTSTVLAVDVGGTKLSAALVSRDLEVQVAEEVPTPRSMAGCDPGLVELAALVDRLMVRAQDHGLRVEAIGLGFPEYTIADRLTSREVFAWDVQPTAMFASVGLRRTRRGRVRRALRGPGRGTERTARRDAVLRLVGHRHLQHARRRWWGVPHRSARRGNRPRRVRRGTRRRCGMGRQPGGVRLRPGCRAALRRTRRRRRSRLPRDHRARRSWATRRPQDRCVRELSGRTRTARMCRLARP